MRWIIFIIIYILLDIYVFQAFKTITKQSWTYYIYLGLSLAVLANFYYQFNFTGDKGLSGAKSYAIGFLLVFFVPKLVLGIFLLGEDLVRLVVGGVSKLSHSGQDFSLPSRRKFLSQLALGAAAIPFASLLYGMYKGKYNYKVLKYTLYFDDLPEAFDGYRFTQISDIHSGSFTDHKSIQYGVDLINEQKSDVIFFTGDLVNNKAEEMDSWKSMFSKIEARDGVFSILGNHDYGDYVDWESEEAKKANLQALKRVHADMGWKLLLNEHRYLEKDGQKIAVVGVENWGSGGFTKQGDIEKASEGVNKEDFKILLSHDPSHWKEKIQKDPKNYQLTLSGHTHGMQFGIENPGWFKWSPVQYRY
ncbi:MAG TPA: metallophosphoesterase, partial [Salinimicrobium sp.]|nr:metallophosphoesterase [Salinimicrobium sp.]